MAEELTKEEAELYSKVYVPAFIEKCAERGITFPDVETLDQGLEATAHLKASMLANQGNQVKQANAAIRQAIGLPDRSVEAKAEATKVTSAGIANDPAVKAAALSLLRNRG